MDEEVEALFIRHRRLSPKMIPLARFNFHNHRNFT